MTADDDFRDGLRHLEAGKLELAERTFRKTIASTPNFAPRHYNLGFVLQRRGRTRQAIHAFQKAV